MDRETRLGLIAASILEGTPVDWPAVESSAVPDDEVVLRQLRILEEVVALHRDVSGDRSPGATSTADAATGGTAAPAMWGHLRLLECVGQGSFGEVYRAWDTHLDREVALKLLRARPTPLDPSASLSDPARVVHEGRLLARLRHPHVITVYGAEPRDGSVGLWMEFIRGTTLHRLVEQQGRLGAREAAAIGMDLCRALAAVHRAGLLHRDISARNVMREEGGRVVLMDFGAGHDGGVPRETGGGITGTPLYMAPELFSGGTADQRSDIYSLGTLLFYLVTAQYPVSGRSLDEVRQAHARGERMRLRDLRADVPAAFVRVVEQSLAVDPRQRFQTAGEMEAALETIEPAVGGALRPETRRRWIAVAAVAAAAMVVATIVVYVSRDGTSSQVGQPGAVAAPAALTTRRIDPPPEVWLFSNPSDDGRYAAGMVNETGDAAVVDLVAGKFRTLGIGTDQSEGYASLGVMSPDGSTVAVDYHTDRGGNLYIAGTDGSRPRLVSEAPDDVSPYQWSRDGSMILAVVERLGRPAAVVLVAVSDGAVRQVAEIGTVRPTHMGLSPDNRYIAYDAPAAPGAAERDIFILDAHTGNRWPLDASPGEDVAPFWTPDGRALVFLSDRNRNPSMWLAPVDQGRLQGPPRLLKDGVGRVFLRGFTAAGAMHYDLTAGFAEVHVASIDGARPLQPEPMSPRRAVSNFYPKWSPDGRFVAYAAEGSDIYATQARRELWTYDTAAGRETRVPFDDPIGLPVGWSRDSREILVGGPQRLVIVDRESGRSRVIATDHDGQSAWGPAGVLLRQKEQIVLVDPANGQTIRTIGPQSDSIVSPDGRSVLWKRPTGRLALLDVVSGLVREWADAVEWIGRMHSMAPHTSGVAYVAGRKGVNGEARSLMYWSGAGDPRELLRVTGSDQFMLAGWLPDGLNLLVVRFSRRPDAPASELRSETLWRVPITGGPAVSTGLTMEGLRDVSIHPDGRRIAFNAGWKRGELWVMENVLDR